MEMQDYEILTDGLIDLKLMSRNHGDMDLGWCPEYKFQIRLHGQDSPIGHINARIGDSEKIIKYIGHIGYGIDEEHRGRRYALRACGLIQGVFLDHGMKSLVITCNPDNLASRRTCELLGAELLEIVDVPEWLEIHSVEESQKCRYQWLIGV